MPPTDERAASEVIGAIILFGFFVITFSVYQGVVVPQQNEEIEFNHNEAVQDAVQDLRNAIRATATTGAEEAVSIKLGATYPERVLAVNPGVGAGTIRTHELGPFSITNVTATDPEVRDYIGATSPSVGPFASKGLVYRPVYFQYSNAPETRYENTVAYNTFPNGANLSVTDQAVVDGRRITLIALVGNVSEARQGTVSIDTEAVSTATSTVVVSESGGPITVTVSTRLTASDWEALLEDELDPPGGPDEPFKFVRAVRQAGPNRVSIVLEQGEQYQLRLAQVGVGSATPETTAKYVVDVEGDDTSVIENGTQQLVVEVRDRFNNPVSNVSVDAAVVQPANASGSKEGVTAAAGDDTTDADGRATFVYAAPANVDGTQAAEVNLTISSDGTVRNETVTFDLRVLDADGSGGRAGSDVEDVNPGSTGSVILDDTSNIPGGGDATVTITLKNSTNDPGVEITAARVSFYFDGDPGAGAGQPPPTQVDLYSSAQGVGPAQATTLQFQEDFKNLTATIPINPTPGDSSDTTVINLDFDERVAEEDFYVISLKFSNGDTFTYFITHP